MAETLTKKQRSYIMSRIRSSKTKPEIKLKPTMEILGFEYQLKGVYGKPDFANKKQRIAVFVDGCFWHKCPKHYKAPKSNTGYWRPKIERNAKRDRAVNKVLMTGGWKVIRIWEHEIKGIKGQRLNRCIGICYED